MAANDSGFESLRDGATVAAVVIACNSVITIATERMRRRTMGEMTLDELRGWFAGRLPDEWFTGAPEITVDREEILVVGDLPEVKATQGAGEAEGAAARESRVDAFREDTREQRMAIA